MIGSKSKASEGASQSVVPRSVSSSSSSSLPTEVGSDSDSGYGSFINEDFRIDSDYGDSDDSDSQSGGFEPNERGKLIASIGEPASHLLLICLCVFFLFNPACLSLA